MKPCAGRLAAVADLTPNSRAGSKGITLKLDGRFRDAGSERPGVSMDGKSWPHGFHGDAYPHGTVFSRPSAVVKSASTRD